MYKYIFGKQIKPLYLINTLELYLDRLLFLILLPVAVLNGFEAGTYIYFFLQLQLGSRVKFPSSMFSRHVCLSLHRGRTMNFTRLIPLFFSSYLPLSRNKVAVYKSEVVLYTHITWFYSVKVSEDLCMTYWYTIVSLLASGILYLAACVFCL